MELGMLGASLICLLAVIVSGAEVAIDPPQKEEQLTISKLEEADHGPLMKALLAPGENSSTESPELQRDKRHKKGGYGGGGCGHRGCGGSVPVYQQPSGGYCNTCGGGGGGGSYSFSQSSSSSGSWGGKK
ncbi:uncharacterized protein [Halyomorpha halys]|uniref:uncharacterized protein n=1 Tax=Halyomorpha halys TaxID=286706 RepID=UPI0006D51241|nr:uncharacterized protein LOC106680958 [Halyomorpha halys]